MVLWIGVDDTDSLRGMCTTFLATELVRDLTRDYDLIGYPRLVRLNPNIPWKTRGNGALCIRVGEGTGSPWRAGRADGRDILAYPRGRTPDDPADVVNRVAALVEEWACFDDETTHPGFAVLDRPPAQGLYWKAVRDVVTKAEALRAGRGRGTVRGYKRGRGVVGALAATAWRPRDRTYEVLAYREPSRWGSPRAVDPESVIAMDQAVPTTFNNYDYENRRAVIAPRSPCPVLFGIRGDIPEDLGSAQEMVRGERPDRTLVFETNQGTDDHVSPVSSLRPWTTVRFRGTVSGGPVDLPGGHVVFQVGAADVTAYEPSKGFRAVVRTLVHGDQVEVIGAVRDVPRTLNLEKLGVLSLTRLVRRVGNPRCERCQKRAKSVGRNAGFRCARCRAKFPAAAAKVIEVPRAIPVGWYEPPVGSRRHLSKPLKRGLPREIGRVARPAYAESARASTPR